MLPGDVPGDGEAQTCATSGCRTSPVEACEALEDALALRFGDTGAVVVHGEDDLTVVIGE